MLEDIYHIQSLNIFYILDMLGTFAFAIGGSYKARSLWLNLFAVIALGIITAVGGGTMRDLAIWRTPLFYIKDINYIILGIIAGAMSFALPMLVKKAYSIFRFIDSIGLAIFVIIGTNIGIIFFLEKVGDYDIIQMWIVSIILWMITGFWWGVLRDTIIWQTPYAFKKNANYVTAAFLGATVYFMLVHINVILWIAISFMLTMVYREIISPYWIINRWYFKKSKKLKKWKSY